MATIEPSTGQVFLHHHDSRYVNITGDTMTGGLTIQPATNTLTALVVNNKDANNVLTVDTINNRVGIGVAAPTARLHIVGFADTQQLIVKANSTQTANLQEWQNSSGTVKAAIGGAGRFALNLSATATPSALYGMYLFDNTTTLTNQLLFNSEQRVSITSAATSNYQALGFTSTIDASTATTSGDVTGIFGISGINGNCVSALSFANKFKCFDVYIQNYSSTATLANAYGVYIRTPQGTGAITNAYGLYVEDQTRGGTLNYAIYTNAGFVYHSDKVGINQTGTLTRMLHVNTGSTTGQFGATRISSTFTNPVAQIYVDNYLETTLGLTDNQAGASDFYGVQAVVQTTNTGKTWHASTQSRSLMFQFTHNDTATTFPNAYGFWGNIKNASTGTITNAYAMYPFVQNTSTGTIGLAVGVYIPSFINSGGGTITTVRGLHIDNQTVGSSTNHAIYTGTGLVHFGDTVDLASGKNLTLLAGNITTDTTTGSSFGGTTSQKISFYGKTPIIQPTALTTALTTITYTAPGTPDYALQDITQTTPWGFADREEARTFISVVKNLQDRINGLESRLQSLGLLA